MAKCSRCGRSIGNAKVCPYCWAGPSESALDKGMRRVAKATGTALEKGVKATESVVRGAKPLVKTVFQEGKKGLSKARSETLKVAKSLKEEDK